MSERGETKAFSREGYGATATAGKIGRDKGTVSRKIKRGTA
ncbi:MAG: IS30 family transposase, partial [Acidaminococcales bacterium]|nr:IS30 family transposase [Acidaminococcales bacterium]